jgi:hypothetical protein
LAVEIDGNRELANGLATYYVGTKLPYAQYVEYGSGPHNNDGDGSFTESIIEWTKRVLGGDKHDSFKIAQHIRANGLKPRPYFRRAVVKEAPNFKLTWSTMLAERLEAEFENIT